MQSYRRTRSTAATCYMLSVFGGVCAQGGQATEHATAERAEWRLRTAEEAIERTRALIGCKGKSTEVVDTVVVKLTQDDTPYLNNELLGRDLWHIVVLDWKLELKSTPLGYKDERSRVADVYLDPVTRQILKLKTRWPDGEKQMAPEVSAEIGAEQMRQSGRKRFHGFPKEDPEVTLLEALDTIAETWGDPLGAKQIVAYYVNWSRMGREVKPVWAVMLRGVPEIKPLPGTPENRVTQYTYIVDARTGQLLIMTNVPRPDRNGANANVLPDVAPDRDGERPR